jgi:hypothetical protein
VGGVRFFLEGSGYGWRTAQSFAIYENFWEVGCCFVVGGIELGSAVEHPKVWDGPTAHVATKPFDFIEVSCGREAYRMCPLLSECGTEPIGFTRQKIGAI